MVLELTNILAHVMLGESKYGRVPVARIDMTDVTDVDGTHTLWHNGNVWLCAFVIEMLRIHMRKANTYPAGYATKDDWFAHLTYGIIRPLEQCMEYEGRHYDGNLMCTDTEDMMKAAFHVLAEAMPHLYD